MIKYLEMARWRFFLMRRQKLVLGALIFGLAGALLSFAVASTSYLSPTKVYWDFTLGMFFMFALLLVILVGAHLFADERQRRTLHLLLASGISRRAWMWGNFLGIGISIAGLLMLWGGVGFLLSLLLPPASEVDLQLLIQAQLVLGAEALVVLAMSFALSMFLRPMLALILSLSLTVFLHSQISLTAILTDPQTGAFTSPALQPVLQWLVPLLPPLEWFDLRVLVGYQSALSWFQIGGLLTMASLWCLFWMELGLWKFSRTDL